MKRIVILFFIVIATLSAYGQTALEIGNECFAKGDYTCAITNYNEALKSATGARKEIISINLKNAQDCAHYLSTANDAFSSKNYSLAKENYQSILKLNERDEYAKTQLEECNKLLIPPVTLNVSKTNLSVSSSGGNESITVTTNVGSYSVSGLPAWCTVHNKYSNSFSIECTPNPSSSTRTDYLIVTAGEKSVRINISQAGKTVSKTIATTLTTSTQNLTFNASGGNKAIIDVKTSGSDYNITALPSWCRVGNKHFGWFSLVCDANYYSQSRSDWFKVTAGDKEVRINISQSGTRSTSSSAPQRHSSATRAKKTKCFNCPKSRNIWGLTVGYIQNPNNYSEGIQLGLRLEPLFKYGFGLTTGVNYESSSTNLSSALFGDGEFDQDVWNIPLHAQYRLNFSKMFNVFAYGGGGFNYLTDKLYGGTENLFSLEYGGGLRINKVQFNVGWSQYRSNLRSQYYYGYNPYGFDEHTLVGKVSYRKIIYSVSYMF